MKKNGFTLLEMIVVMMLIALVLGLSTVYFAGMLPSYRLRATGREMAAMIRYARALARMQEDTEEVVIDLDGRIYGIEKQVAKSIPQPVSIKIIDPVDGEILHGKYNFVCYPAGGLEGGTIILSVGKKHLRIEPDPITGAVPIKDG